jgi:hypothetical protein
MRVQIPAYTDWWMRGARFGEVVSTYRERPAQTAPDREPREIARVKLDANGKVIRVILDDCTIV